MSKFTNFKEDADSYNTPEIDIGDIFFYCNTKLEIQKIETFPHTIRNYNKIEASLVEH